MCHSTAPAPAGPAMPHDRSCVARKTRGLPPFLPRARSGRPAPAVADNILAAAPVGVRKPELVSRVQLLLRSRARGGLLRARVPAAAGDRVGADEVRAAERIVLPEPAARLEVAARRPCTGACGSRPSAAASRSSRGAAVRAAARTRGGRLGAGAERCGRGSWRTGGWAVAAAMIAALPTPSLEETRWMLCS
jgi:hypothetical protein